MAVALRDVIPLVLEKQHDWRVGLARDWHLIVGTLATRTCLEKIYDDTVIIGVYESHWMQELYLLSSDIKDSINSTLKVSRINHIRFKLVEEKKRTHRIVLPKKVKRPATVSLSTSQAQALARITDEGLKQALTDFWGALYRISGEVIMAHKVVQKKVICGVAGASGGHIIPGITLLRTLAQQEDAEVLFFSTNTHFDRSILGHYHTNFTHCSLPVIPVPGKKLWRYPLFLYRTFQAFFKSLRTLRRYQPSKVISMGGFISVPVCLAARVLRIDVQLFELNAVPGKAVRWLAPYAQKIFVCFDDAASTFDQKKVQHAPYPLRFSEEDRISQADARAQLGLSPEKKVILVLGGSQGSQALNALMKKFFESTSDKQIAVIHQSGAAKGSDPQKEFEQFYKEKGIEALVFAYTHELNICYSAADLVISRAGAGSLFELEFFKKRSILIPLEISAEAHQLENALAMIKQAPELFSLARQEHVQKNPAVLEVFIHKGLS